MLCDAALNWTEEEAKAADCAEAPRPGVSRKTAAQAMAQQVSTRPQYFDEIETLFVRRRGKHLWLSPKDWALIQSWQDRGIPLHVALGGIERAFDLHNASAHRRRDINSLSYCRGEVEAQYAEWLKRQGGSASQFPESFPPKVGSDVDARLPFPRAQILEHLKNCHAALTKMRGSRAETHEVRFEAAVSKAAARLLRLTENFAGAEEPDVERLEEDLTGLEAYLSEALLAQLSPDRLSVERLEIEAQLSSYRGRVRRDVFEEMTNNLMRKRLRERLGIPPLSLFHL